MLSKMIVSSYHLFLEICLWLILLGSFFGGWYAKGFGGAIVSLLFAFVISVALFGAFLVLSDIRTSVRAIEAKQKAQTGGDPQAAVSKPQAAVSKPWEHE